MTYEEFGKKVGKAISELKRTKTKEIVLVHHDDGDGLCSAAITKTALEREDYLVKPLCLEKIYPEVISSLHEGSGKVIFYTDIGSSHADFISKCNLSRNLTIILDHHDPMPAKDPKVYDLNLENYDFQGESDFSGATCCYLFAKALNKHNTDLSYLALVGSCEIPDGFVGLNKVVLDETVRNGIVEIGNGKFRIVKFGIRIDDLFSKLQVLGAAGYYEEGPSIGVEACLRGITDEVKRKIAELEDRRKQANKRLISRLYRERLKETEHIQWFEADNTYERMGTKVIGQFCSFLSYQTRLIKPDKYILGIMNVSPDVPGWGKLKEKFMKVSVRLPKNLQLLIDRREMPGAVDLLREASKGFGVADGHKDAANVIVPLDKKDILIKNAEKVLSVYK